VESVEADAASTFTEEFQDAVHENYPDYDMDIEVGEFDIDNGVDNDENMVPILIGVVAAVFACGSAVYLYMYFSGRTKSNHQQVPTNPSMAMTVVAQQGHALPGMVQVNSHHPDHPTGPPPQIDDTVRVGSRVVTDSGKRGIVRYMGEVKFAPGNWVGLELDQPTGMNDGSVQGVRYFQCQPSYGSFVKEGSEHHCRVDKQYYAAAAAAAVSSL